MAADDAAPSLVAVPEIRDYHQINHEVVRRLEAGHGRVRLVGVERQRLLLAGLRGGWEAIVEVEGEAGPELAAELEAPGLIVACLGGAADGAGRALAAGTLLIAGAAGTAAGLGQRGGRVVLAGPAGPRAGLGQRGGLLVALGAVGPLAGERSRGGVVALLAARSATRRGTPVAAGRSALPEAACPGRARSAPMIGAPWTSPPRIWHPG